MVTNHHVIPGHRTLSVVTPEGRRAASVVSSKVSVDPALLRVIGRAVKLKMVLDIGKSMRRQGQTYFPEKY